MSAAGLGSWLLSHTICLVLASDKVTCSVSSRLQEFVEGNSSLSLVFSFVGIFNGYRATLILLQLLLVSFFLSDVYKLCLQRPYLGLTQLSAICPLALGSCFLNYSGNLSFSSKNRKAKDPQVPSVRQTHMLHRTFMTSHFYFFLDTCTGV